MTEMSVGGAPAGRARGSRNVRNLRLGGKVAVVTGGARGIGRAIVRAFVVEGASVAIIDLKNGSDAEPIVVSDKRASQPYVLTLEADVSDDEAVRQAIATVVQEFGRIDILVNNAAITQRKAFVELTPTDWDAVMSVDLKGVFLVTRHVVPSMLSQGGGRIVNIASQLGQRGAPLLAHYCAAKAGVIGLTKALARELAPTITVNAIAPGPIRTRVLDDRSPDWFGQIVSELPLARLGIPDEVAPTAVFLASNDGALYTGQTLGPNCGHVML